VNASYNWLRAFVDFKETPQQLRDLITSRVATVDELVSLRADLENIVVARVVEEGPHPDSDHLHVTKVDAGTGELLDVVCGAPNVTAGKLYPFAKSGTVMPNGMKIEKRKIRGQVSNGMICSARELNLGEEQDGVMELSIDVPPGTPFLQALPVGDTQIVIDVGANRPDLLSHLGIAREIAALTNRKFSLPRLGLLVPGVPPANRTGLAGPIAVHVEDPSLIRRFMGVVVRGVKVGPSPQWLIDRLASIGSRSINNVVDASNYVLHELGQPTHAFDLAKLGGGEIRVRLAKAGEKVKTLDGTERALKGETIVIADATRAQAIAGIMGGQESEVTEATTDLFIEVANFDPARIRTARKALGMSTDASYRFERGVDVDLAPQALERVTQIIIALAGGQVDGAPVDIRPAGAEPRQIALRTSRVTQVLGDAIPATDIDRYLSSIGFEMQRGDAEHGGALVPSWRSDVTAEIDLVEEVARLHGYDKFSDEIRPFRPSNVPEDALWAMSRRVRDYLVGQGLYEVRPLPFVAGTEEHVRLQNPLAENEGHLRRAVMESLVSRAEFNLAHMQRDVRLFEIGDVFAPAKGPLPTESLNVSLLVMGRRAPRHFTDPSGPAFEEWASFDRWDVEAMAREICAMAFPGQNVVLSAAKDPLPGADQKQVLRSGQDDTLVADWIIVREGTNIGRVGRVRLDAPVWASPAWGLEITLGRVESRAPAEKGQHSYVSPDRRQTVTAKFKGLPTTPPAEFDLALLLPAGCSAAEVEKVIRAQAGELLERLELFDQYVGQGVGDGQRSVAWRLTFRHPERTLRDKEIEGRRAKTLSSLEKELNVRARTS
jgi:phenylalanyl-tRNA synthetase beta chain